MARTKIIIATVKSWNIENALKFKNQFSENYDVEVISNQKDLSLREITRISPSYIFFPHWSWIIPENIYKKYECIVFHMTDLPYGRGGTPLQNLILNKIYKTKVSAIKVEKGIDAGPIYLKKSFNIGRLSNAEEIYRRLSKVIFLEMIPYILQYKPTPKKQTGKIVTFIRRKPEESNILQSKISNLDDAYDFIRMLDAEGYPKVFIKKDKIKILFSDVNKLKNKLIGKYEIIYEK